MVLKETQMKGWDAHNVGQYISGVENKFDFINIEW